MNLELRKDGKLLFASEKTRLRPLMECLEQFMGKLEGCELYDKIVGLAAARLIVYSKLITSVKAGTLSLPAKELLEAAGIEVASENLVPVILNNELTGPCPMELKAKDVSNEEFYNHMKALLG